MSISLSLLAAAAAVVEDADVTDLIGLKHYNIQIQANTGTAVRHSCSQLDVVVHSEIKQHYLISVLFVKLCWLSFPGVV